MKFITTAILPDFPKSKWYFAVKIFHSKRSMYKHRDELCKDGANKMRKPHNYLACCSTFNSKENKYQYGVLLFTKSSARQAGIVSHEIAHAVNYWFKHAKTKYNWNDIPKKSQADEEYAHILGFMVSQYWRQWHKLPKAYKK